MNIMSDQDKSDEWLLENAISCWLYHFPEHEWTEQYKELLNKVKHGQYKNTKARTRGRPAERQRTKKPTSDKTIKEKNKTINP